MSNTKEKSIFLDAVIYTIDPGLNIESPSLSGGLDYWNTLRQDRLMPSPADIDPLNLPTNLLPHILLLDVEHTPVFRLRWRLVGTHITGVLGRDSTGKYWDENYDQEEYDALSTGPLWVIKNHRPLRVMGNANYADKSFIKSESVDLPFSRDGNSVDRIMVITEFSSK